MEARMEPLRDRWLVLKHDYAELERLHRSHWWRYLLAMLAALVVVALALLALSKGPADNVVVDLVVAAVGLLGAFGAVIFFEGWDAYRSRRFRSVATASLAAGLRTFAGLALMSAIMWARWYLDRSHAESAASHHHVALVLTIAWLGLPLVQLPLFRLGWRAASRRDPTPAAPQSPQPSPPQSL